MTVDLSYAKQAGDPARPKGSLALDTRGWSCGWAVVVGDSPIDCGMFTARDHADGKPIPPSHKMAGLFRSLLMIGAKHDVDLVVTEVKAKQGPIWMLPALCAVSLAARYGEISDWLAELKLDEKSLKSWATVLLGKEPEDELVSTSLGLAAVASRIRGRAPEVLTSPPPEEA